MAEREKGPGPTLPEEVFVFRGEWGGDGDPDYFCHEYEMHAEGRRVVCSEMGEGLALSPIARYVRADRYCSLCGGNVGDDVHARECRGLDPEREKLVEAVLAVTGAAIRGEVGASTADKLGAIYAAWRALEAHDAKGEAGR